MSKTLHSNSDLAYCFKHINSVLGFPHGESNENELDVYLRGMGIL